MSERSERNGAGGGPPDIVRVGVRRADRHRPGPGPGVLGGSARLRGVPPRSPTRSTSAATRSSSTTASSCGPAPRPPAGASASGCGRPRTSTGPSSGTARWVARRRRIPAGTTRGPRRGRAWPRSARLHHRARARDGQGGAAGPALRPPPGRQHLADRPRQHRRARRPRRLRVLHGSRLRSVGDHRGLPTARCTRRGCSASKQSTTSPSRSARGRCSTTWVRRAGVPPHPRAVRHASAPSTWRTTSSGAPAATACPTRSTSTSVTRRPPRRDVHVGLLHRRPRPRAAALERPRRAPPGLLGQSRRAELVPGLGRRCSTSTAGPCPSSTRSPPSGR